MGHPVTAEQNVRNASHNQGSFDVTTEPALRILRDAEVVFAVLQDLRAKNGGLPLMLKGEALLGKVAKGSSSLFNEIKWLAVKCSI